MEVVQTKERKGNQCKNKAVKGESGKGVLMRNKQGTRKDKWKNKHIVNLR